MIIWEPYSNFLVRLIGSVLLSDPALCSMLAQGFRRAAASSYLYVLLLPCTFIVWVVRFGFGLDSTDLTNAEFPFSGLSFMWALTAIIGAATTFFIVLKIFENIIALSLQETERALLNHQMTTHRQPDIEITIKACHQFLSIEATNPAPSTTMPSPGTGLRNIFRAAEKYQGTTEISTDNGRFRLSVLLCLMTDVPPDTKRK